MPYREFLENWRRNFYGWNAADFGWGADTVQNVLWRVSNGELDGVGPKVIVLLAGTNNVGNAPRDGVDTAVVEEVARGIARIVAMMRAKAPDATVVLTAVTPRRDRNGGTTVMPTIDAINTRIVKLADGAQDSLRQHQQPSRGGRRPARGRDDRRRTTPLRPGYQVWADALKPIFTEILGPPAAIDHAPPPSGDPSIGR